MATNPKLFPIITASGDTIIEEGITLKDYFAGKVIEAYFSIPEHWDKKAKSNALGQEQITDIAYDVAEAALNSRENKI